MGSQYGPSKSLYILTKLSHHISNLTLCYYNIKMKQLFAYYTQTGIRNHVGDVIHLSSDSKALNNSSSGIIIRYVKSLN